MRALLATLLALALLAAPVPAGAAEPPRTSLADIEDEVMCLECQTPLNVSTSAVADQERDFIAELIDQGLTKEQVKARLVDEYGPRVLAQPRDEGFDLAAWLVPGVAALAAIGLVIVVARRWRGRGPDAGAAAGPALDPDDARRLDAELAAFDR